MILQRGGGGDEFQEHDVSQRVEQREGLLHNTLIDWMPRAKRTLPVDAKIAAATVWHIWSGEGGEAWLKRWRTRKGEWTNINADLVDGKVKGWDIIVGMPSVAMPLRSTFPFKSERVVRGRTLAVASSALAATLHGSRTALHAVTAKVAEWHYYYYY